ncbi:hypothetical protein ACFL5X_01530 [Candidatus Omnitrophota bacterium]
MSKSTEFLGFHSEWNMGSPGGWDYQRMAQEIGSYAWKKIQERVKIDLRLDFDAPLLNPVSRFGALLLKAHNRNFGRAKAFIALVAEKETLEKVGENIRFVRYLNSLEGVSAVLIAPEQLSLREGKVFLEDHMITAMFVDFNNSVILKIQRNNDLKPLLEAIRQGLVINPRGMEPVGSKGVFEAITGQLRELMHESTFRRTPWTRQFYPRSTDGPDGKPIADLIQWTKDNWQGVILKPVHGYSGQGIFIGFKEPDADRAIKQALDAGDYIVQPLIPLELWAEDFPWIDRENKKVFIKTWQTDFRCFITPAGLMGVVTRFGGIPTNVGSGGGVQSSAILRSDMPVAEAIKRVNDAIVGLGFDFVAELQDRIDKKSLEMGNIYLLGPIMSTLRPRLLKPAHIDQLTVYAKNIWDDALKLEEIWRAGKLSKYAQISKAEEAIAKLCPWKGTIALMASDGLFGFTR